MAQTETLERIWQATRPAEGPLWTKQMCDTPDPQTGPTGTV
jgi:hypothetical protein